MLDSGNIFCVGGKTTKQSSYVFNPETKFWVHLKITNFQHIKPYMVQIGFKIFVVNIIHILNIFNFKIIIKLSILAYFYV